MATLAELQSKKGVTSLKRGTTSRSLGSTAVVPTKAAAPKRGSTVEQFAEKVGSVASQTIGMAGSGLKTLGKFAVNTPGYVFNDFKSFLQPVAQTITGELSRDIVNANLRADQIDNQVQEITQQYKSGKMSKENYSKYLKDASKSYSDISRETKQTATQADRGNVVEGAINTTVNILTVGQLQMAKVAGKQAAQAGSKEAIKALVKEGATGIERLLLKVPAAAPLLERNLAYLGKRELQKSVGENLAQFTLREGKHLAANLLVKRPIFYQLNIADGKRAYDQIMEGESDDALKTAAWFGTQMLRGGPIGAFTEGLGWMKGRLGTLAYGRDSFIDTVSKQIGDGNPAQIARYLTTLEKKAPKEFGRAERALRIMQETNLRAASEDVTRAAENVTEHYVQHGFDLANVTPSQLVRDMTNWAEADQLAQKTLRSGLVKGVTPEDAGKYVVVRWDQTARAGLIDAYDKEGIQGVAKLMQRPGVGWSNNQVLLNEIEYVANTARNTDDFAAGIRAISAAATELDGVPKRVSQQLAKLGYTIAAPVSHRITPLVDPDDTRKLISGAIRGNTDIFDVSKAANPELRSIASWLERSGISPVAANETANRKLSEAVVTNLNELGAGRALGLTDTQGGDVVGGGRVILSKLQQYIENKRPALNLGRSAAITDIRQLRIGEIQEVLKVDKAMAKNISKAIMQGYLDVPLEFRGLGDKIVDYAYRINPGQKHYSRIQSAFRYTYNPFFRTQEAVETRILSRTQASNLIWNKSRGELEEAVGLLDKSGIFTSSFSGEAAQDQVLGRISANITRGQKRDLAGLALDLAESRGMSLQELATNHADEIDDALRVVVQYPRRGLLASPLARTLNVAFFPMRYNLKVATLAAEALAKQPPAIQKAVVHSVFKMKDWLKSDEGIQWQSDNNDAISLLQWITPANSITYVMGLLGRKPDSISELGVLGGLPFGIISQMLDSQGIIRLNRPYVSPETGDVFPRYIPETTKARAATAVGDLLNSMFTYPGRILGLPGKNQAIRNAVRGFIDTNGTDFEKRIDTENLTPLQQNWVRVLKGDTSDEAIDALYNSPAPGEFNWYTIPPLDLPIRTPGKDLEPVKQRKGLPSKESKKKGKKPKKTAQPISL